MLNYEISIGLDDPMPETLQGILDEIHILQTQIMRIEDQVENYELAEDPDNAPDFAWYVKAKRALKYKRLRLQRTQTHLALYQNQAIRFFEIARRELDPQDFAEMLAEVA